MQFHLGLGVALKFLADQIAELENQRFANPVADLIAVALATEKPHIEHHDELFGDVRLLQPGLGDQVGDIHGAGLEHVEKGQACRIGEHAEEAADGLKLSGAEWKSIIHDFVLDNIPNL